VLLASFRPVVLDMWAMWIIPFIGVLFLISWQGTWAMLEGMVYLPLYPGMPDEGIERMAEILLRTDPGAAHV